jgi:hypothetical protein
MCLKQVPGVQMEREEVTLDNYNAYFIVLTYISRLLETVSFITKL